MLVFGEKAIPKEIRNSCEYRPFNVDLGFNYNDDSIVVDIKPMFYVYHLDMRDTNMDIADWIEQCLARMVISLSEMTEITDPERLVSWTAKLESALWMIICAANPYGVIEI